MKKILSILVAGLLLLSLVSCGDEETTDGETGSTEAVINNYVEDVNKTGKFTYKENEKGEYELEKYEPYSVQPIDLVLPTEINGRYVVGIGKGIFNGKNNIRSVIFEANSKYEYIAQGAFADCDLLTSIVLPSTIKEIGANAFDDCNALTSVTLSSEIEVISEFAFANCNALKAIDLSNVTTINEGAFMNCSELTNVIVSNNIEYADMTAFEKCDKLVYNKNNGLCYLGNTANPNVLLVKPESLDIKTSTISANTKVVADYAFLNCTELESLTLADSITSINGTAFENCGKLVYNFSENGNYLGSATNKYMVLIKMENPTLEDFILNKDTKIITATAFAEATNLEDIGYDDLEAAWENIIKAADWDYDISKNVSVTFSDGTIKTLAELEAPEEPETEAATEAVTAAPSATAAPVASETAA